MFLARLVVVFAIHDFNSKPIYVTLSVLLYLSYICMSMANTSVVLLIS